MDSPKYSEWSATQKTNTNAELSGTNVIYVLSFPAFQLVERLYDPGTEHPPPHPLFIFPTEYWSISPGHSHACQRFTSKSD